MSLPPLTRAQAAELCMIAQSALSARCISANNCIGPNNANVQDLPHEVDKMQVARRWYDHACKIARARLSTQEVQMVRDARAINPKMDTKQLADLLYGRTTLAKIYESINPVGSRHGQGLGDSARPRQQGKSA